MLSSCCTTVVCFRIYRPEKSLCNAMYIPIIHAGIKRASHTVIYRKHFSKTHAPRTHNPPNCLSGLFNKFVFHSGMFYLSLKQKLEETVRGVVGGEQSICQCSIQNLDAYIVTHIFRGGVCVCFDASLCLLRLLYISFKSGAGEKQLYDQRVATQTVWCQDIYKFHVIWPRL